MSGIKEVILSEQKLHPHTDGFNYFLDIAMPRIIQQQCTIDVETNDKTKVRTEITNIQYEHPEFSIHEAHRNSKTYSSKVFADVKLFIDDQLETEHKHLYLFETPIIVGSNACLLSKGIGHDELINTEYGGIFIINGKRKYISSTKELRRNVPIVYTRVKKSSKKTSKKKAAAVSVRCDHVGLPERSSNTIKILLGSRAKDYYGFEVIMPYTKKRLSLGELLAVMKVPVSTFLSVLQSISKYYKYMDSYTSRIRTSEVTYEYALKKMIANYDPVKEPEKIMQSKVRDILFSHIGHGSTFKDEKVKYLAYLVEMLIKRDIGIGNQTEMSDIGMYQLHETGMLYTQLFKKKLTDVVNANVSKIKKQKESNIISLDKILCFTNLTNQLKKCISSGNWTKDKPGVSNDMNANNELETLCHLRKVSSGLASKKGKHGGSRTIHKSHRGKLCVVRTTEGSQCGLIKELASTCQVSPYQDLTRENDLINKSIVDLLDSSGDVRVFDSYGRWVGNAKDKQKMIDSFRERRAQGYFSFYSDIVEMFEDELYIFAQGGRLLTPILRKPENYKPGMNLPELYTNQVIELIEHIDADTRLIFQGQLSGMNSGQNPFVNHNMGPRNAYQTGMAFQSTTSNVFDQRGKSTKDECEYAQRPLSNTALSMATGLDTGSLRGQCMVVAVCAYPRDQEDGIIINEATLQLGGFRRTHKHTYKSETKNQSDVFQRPSASETQGYQYGSYDHLEDNGLPKKRQKIENGDIVIGKTVPSISKEGNVILPKSMSGSTELRRDVSITHTQTKGIVIDTHISTEAPFQHSVTVASSMDVELGDKFASRHGQKGTVCEIIPKVDMPFDQFGITPDIIIAPEAFPSRMTMGKLLEILVSKAAAIEGNLDIGIDDQSFNSENVKTHAENILLKHGFHKEGTQMLTDGVTGEMFEVSMMMGVVHYAQLTHFAAKKMYGRINWCTFCTYTSTKLWSKKWWWITIWCHGK